MELSHDPAFRMHKMLKSTVLCIYIQYDEDAHMRGNLMVLVALQIGPYAVPKGTVVHVGLYTMHRDQRWWKDAEAFKPERWVGDETGGDKSGGLAYMPFGLGPRKCIGYKLAGEHKFA